MASTDATTVDQYLAELPEDRRLAIEMVRAEILANLPEGYEETMAWGMISYDIPLATYPDTYNGKPLMYAALASQKNHMAVYLSAIYADPDLLGWFTEEYEATGKKQDIGKSCVRFKKVENLPVELIGEAIAKFSVGDYIALHEAARAK